MSPATTNASGPNPPASRATAAIRSGVVIGRCRSDVNATFTAGMVAVNSVVRRTGRWKSAEADRNQSYLKVRVRDDDQHLAQGSGQPPPAEGANARPIHGR